MEEPVRVGIITVSDRATAGEADDLSGPRLRSLVDGGQLFPGRTVQLSVVPDETLQIQSVLAELCGRCDLVVTSGGTGFAPRDVTPEAVGTLLDRHAPGLVAAMLHGSLAITPLAMLSRPVAGVIGRCVVATLPGSPRGAEQCLRLLAPGVRHATDLLRERLPAVRATHASQGTPQQHTGGCQHAVQSKVDVSQVSLRPRESPYPAISMKEAEGIIAEQCVSTPCEPETIDVKDALNRVTATAVCAETALPPFRASVKDGYAVLSTDGAGIRRVLGVSNAGESFSANDSSEEKVTVVPGTCARISTGAPLPAGADAVVMVEHTGLAEASADWATELHVEVLRAPKPGQDVRLPGSDFVAGTQVVASNTLIGPLELAALVTAGVRTLSVYRRPRVAVLSTGAELQEPGRPLDAGHIYDTNRTTLLSLLPAAGADARDAGIAPDRPSGLLAAMRTALLTSDVLVTSGGVSMGERDLLKRVLEHDLDATVHFGRVYMKPGLPTTFASLQLQGRRRLVFGLPGNPVSAAVCAVLHVLPAVRALAGRRQWRNTSIPASLQHRRRLDARPEYLRARLELADGRLTARVTNEDQRSSNVLSLCGANALVVLPARAPDQPDQAVEAGAQVDAIPIFLQL